MSPQNRPTHPRFLVRFRGRITGPYTREQLTDLYRKGIVSRLHEISSDGNNWQPFYTLTGGLASTDADPVPQTQRQPTSPTFDRIIQQTPQNDPTDDQPAHQADDPQDQEILDQILGSTQNAEPEPVDDWMPKEAQTEDRQKTAAAKPEPEPRPEARPKAQSQPEPAPEPRYQWFYADADRQAGPVPHAEALVLVKRGKIKPDTLVWRKGMADWTEARQTALFQDFNETDPANPSVDGDPATFFHRLLAYTLDSVAQGLLILTAVALLAVGMGVLDDIKDGTEPPMGFALLVLFVQFGVLIFYDTVTTATGLQGTPGKRILGMKVTGDTGDPIGLGRSFIRASVKYLVSAPVLCIGFLIALGDDRVKTLHDKLAGTVVTKV